MATVLVSTIAGDSTPCTQIATDSGAGSADNVSGRILTLHRHDAIYKEAWDELYANNFVKNYLVTSISTSGDNTVIAAPGAGNRISIAWFHLDNQSATEVTVILESDTTARFRCVLSPKGSAGSFREMVLPAHMPLDMIANQALVVNLSAAVSVGVSVAYHVRN
jgi:hypothetical protein